MIQTDTVYWSGVAAAIYLVTCWTFAAVRWWHTCREPKEHHDYLFPDRKLLVGIYMMGTVLLPYMINPESQAAWTLWKSYFPGTYFFYSGSLFFCFFGTVKQWNRWKSVFWAAAAITIGAMLPLIIDAWMPNVLLTPDGMKLWNVIVSAVGVGMMGYAGFALWLVMNWMKEARDENFSNTEDFPLDFARRVRLMPLAITIMVWPGYILDSPEVMAVMSVLLAVFNVVLLLNVLPVWRRLAIVAGTQDVSEMSALEETDGEADMQSEERTHRIVNEIEAFVKEGKGYLDPHLKLNTVVAHCTYSRSYVSKVFQEHFDGFYNYVNRLRLEHYDHYMMEHPSATKDAAAQESGFTSYNSYYKVKRAEKRNNI